MRPGKRFSEGAAMAAAGRQRSKACPDMHGAEGRQQLLASDSADNDREARCHKTVAVQPASRARVLGAIRHSPARYIVIGTSEVRQRYAVLQANVRSRTDGAIGVRVQRQDVSRFRLRSTAVEDQTHGATARSNQVSLTPINTRTHNTIR